VILGRKEIGISQARSTLMFSLAKMITCRNTVRLLPNLRLHDPSRYRPNDLLGLAATPVLDDICFAPTKPSEETLRKLALAKSRA
jgi:hypothetical protein